MEEGVALRWRLAASISLAGLLVVLPSRPAAPAVCNGTTGLVEPLPVCSTLEPCIRIAAGLPPVPITSPSDPPTCADSRWDDVSTWSVGGVTRYACLARPAGAGPSSP